LVIYAEKKMTIVDNAYKQDNYGTKQCDKHKQDAGVDYLVHTSAHCTHTHMNMHTSFSRL